MPTLSNAIPQATGAAPGPASTDKNNTSQDQDVAFAKGGPDKYKTPVKTMGKSSPDHIFAAMPSPAARRADIIKDIIKVTDAFKKKSGTK